MCLVGWVGQSKHRKLKGQESQLKKSPENLLKEVRIDKKKKHAQLGRVRKILST